MARNYGRFAMALVYCSLFAAIGLLIWQPDDAGAIALVMAILVGVELCAVGITVRAMIARRQRRVDAKYLDRLHG